MTLFKLFFAETLDDKGSFIQMNPPTISITLAPPLLHRFCQRSLIQRQLQCVNFTTLNHQPNKWQTSAFQLTLEVRTVRSVRVSYLPWLQPRSRVYVKDLQTAWLAMPLCANTGGRWNRDMSHTGYLNWDLFGFYF